MVEIAFPAMGDCYEIETRCLIARDGRRVEIVYRYAGQLEDLDYSSRFGGEVFRYGDLGYERRDVRLSFNGLCSSWTTQNKQARPPAQRSCQLRFAHIRLCVGNWGHKPGDYSLWPFRRLGKTRWI